MFRGILRKLGYIHESEIHGFRDIKTHPLTEEELVSMLLKAMGQEEIEFPAKEQAKLFSELKEVENFPTYLKLTAQNDKDRYFATGSTDEQKIIRGAFLRTMYLRNRVINPEKVNKKEETKIEGIRYGT